MPKKQKRQREEKLQTESGRNELQTAEPQDKTEELQQTTTIKDLIPDGALYVLSTTAAFRKKSETNKAWYIARNAAWIVTILFVLAVLFTGPAEYSLIASNMNLVVIILLIDICLTLLCGFSHLIGCDTYIYYYPESIVICVDHKPKKIKGEERAVYSMRYDEMLQASYDWKTKKFRLVGAGSAALFDYDADGKPEDTAASFNTWETGFVKLNMKMVHIDMKTITEMYSPIHVIARNKDYAGK